MIRRIAAVTVLLLVLASCGGDEGAEDTSSQASPSAAAASEAPAATASAGTPSPGRTTAPASVGTARPAPDAPASAAPARSAAPGGVNRPRTGRYTYEVTGEATDPFTGQRQPVPDGARAFTEISASGNVLTSETTNNQMQGEVTTRSRWETTKVSLLEFRITQPVVNVRCDYDPPLEILHMPVKRETFPSQTRKDGTDCTQTTRIQVVGQEDVRAMGRVWKTWKITQRTTYNFNNGGITGTLNQTLWVAPDLGTSVKSDEINDGTYKTTTGGQRIYSRTKTLLIDRP